MSKNLLCVLLVAFASCTILILQNAGTEEETVTLVAKFVRGEKWYVLTDVSMTVTVTRTDRRGTSSETKIVTRRVDTIERTHDEVDESGKLVRMTCDVLRSSVTTSVAGAPPKEAKTPIHGRKIAVTPGKEIPASYADGSKEPVAAEDFTVYDEFLLLLPPKPVAKGDTWEVPGAEIVKFLLKGAETKAATVTAVCKLEDIVSRDGARVAVIALSVSAQTEANPDFAWEYEATGGRLEFNVTSGRPVSLELAGKGKMTWRQLDARKQEIASYTAVVESLGLKISYGTADFVLPSEEEPP